MLFQAAVLSVKLERLEDYIGQRQRAADYYDQALAGVAGIVTPQRSAKSSHVFHQYTLKVRDGRRDALKEYLQNKGIPGMIYYPIPLQDQKAFKDIIKTPVSLQITTDLCHEVLSLPMHTELSEDQLDYICSSITAFYTS